MTKLISAAAFSAIVAATAISVLAQPPAQPPAPQPNAPAAASADRITVTGCLREAPPAASDAATSPQPGTTGTTGTTGAATPPSATPNGVDVKFVLADSTISPASPDAPAVPSTTKEPAKTYRLIANPSALSPHVGKKLELTGTLVNEETPAAGPAVGPALRVEAGKVLAAPCDK